jgi:hypothetical protein
VMAKGEAVTGVAATGSDRAQDPKPGSETKEQEQERDEDTHLCARWVPGELCANGGLPSLRSQGRVCVTWVCEARDAP